jgi:protein ImuB
VIVDARAVLAVNPAARQRGITEGMRLSAAYALCAALQPARRNPAAEREALEAAALWAGQFTPSVAIEPAGGLVMEIEASLALFGGLEAIAARMQEGLAALGLSAILASAPSARGASCLARAGQCSHVGTQAALIAALDALPVGVLDPEPRTVQLLAALGVSRVAGLRALPRAGAARRFGPDLLQRLDEACGLRAQAQRFFVPPERFHARLELPHPTDSAPALLFVAKRLFLQLEGFLRARAGAARGFTLQLEHEDHPDTRMALELAAPGRSAEHFALLVHERLGRIALPQPVQAVCLEMPQVHPLPGQADSLFADAATLPEAWERLLERLQARLGEPALYRVADRPDHRPERAGVRAPAFAAAAEPARPQHAQSQHVQPSPPWRPLWLLREPRALREAAGRLFLERSPGREARGPLALMSRGPLTLVSGPERIESGWWDGHDVVRDYFVAQAAAGPLLWVYRQRHPQAGWFVHGIF